MIVIEIRVPKGALINFIGGLHKLHPCVGLRHMDFLKYSDKDVITYETARYSPSRLTCGLFGTSMFRNF